MIIYLLIRLSANILLLLLCMGGLLPVSLLVLVLTSKSTTAHQIFYVLPDNSTNASCLFQPCATLSQYLLDNNGSLPVVSNVDYHFLPGEYYIPANMTLQYLHNFTIIGSSRNKLLSTIFFIDLQAYVKFYNSIKFAISNVMFRTYDKRYKGYDHRACNIIISKCYSCIIVNVTFLHYGICGENLRGKSYLSNIVIDFTFYYYDGIYLYYEEDSHHTVIIDRITMYGDEHCTSKVANKHRGIYIQWSHEVVNKTFIIRNSQFQRMDKTIVSIGSGRCGTNNRIWIENCTFENNYFDVIVIRLSPYNMTLTLSNCRFYKNEAPSLIAVKVSNYDQCEIPLDASCFSQSNVSITNIVFDGNTGNLFRLLSDELAPCKSNIFIGSMRIYSNNNFLNNFVMYMENFNIYINETLKITFCNEGYTLMSVQSSRISFNGLVSILDENTMDAMMVFKSSYVLFNGEVLISGNTANNILVFQFSDVLFNGPMTISNNRGSIMQMSFSNVSFNSSVKIYNNKIKDVENIYIHIRNMCEYIIQFTSCNILFSKDIFITSNVCKMIVIFKSHRESAYIKVMKYSNITFSDNNCNNVFAIEINPAHNNPYPLCLFQYVALQNSSAILPSHYTIIISDNLLSKCKLSLYHFISHCQWIPTAVFHGHQPEAINQQIIQLNLKPLHSTILHCSNFSTGRDMLGPVHPGQVLQIELCMPCSENYSVLYVETRNTLLPKSACKIAHQTEILNFISENAITVDYTIVSEANHSCELFLTVSPFLYYIYEVFDVQLLPCPIGFTLQNRVCDCDPLLPPDIDTCYIMTIDQSAIRRPANTWISYIQSDTSKYLITDCPMDFCLPFSSNIDLLYPDTQCQFNRTGILCSQCPHSLSMVFGSSRCMKCTNVHILITIIVIVAGIVLVVLLYVLNLTVTKATINGIILYANIISILMIQFS